MTKRKMTDIKNFKVVIYRTALYSPILLRSPHMNTHPPPSIDNQDGLIVQAGWDL